MRLSDKKNNNKIIVPSEDAVHKAWQQLSWNYRYWRDRTRYPKGMFDTGVRGTDQFLQQPQASAASCSAAAAASSSAAAAKPKARVMRTAEQAELDSTMQSPPKTQAVLKSDGNWKRKDAAELIERISIHSSSDEDEPMPQQQIKPRASAASVIAESEAIRFRNSNPLIDKTDWRAAAEYEAIRFHNSNPLIDKTDLRVKPDITQKLQMDAKAGINKIDRILNEFSSRKLTEEEQLEHDIEAAGEDLKMHELQTDTWDTSIFNGTAAKELAESLTQQAREFKHEVPKGPFIASELFSIVRRPLAGTTRNGTKRV